ncbi:uncharacterized protein LOC134717649 [Mytilus trossulus]|uniref:uncharacterized protein LOC134717649 n=1 Tax=Mytilus trossulus TaxID=6551 RepID=UPI0030060D4F
MNSEAQWRNLNDDLGVILETSLQGCVERRIETLTTLVYNIGKERFGVEERKERSNIKQTPNRREQKIKQLRKELKDLNRRYKKSNEIEKLGIACITDNVREELRRTRRAEQLKNSNKKKAKNRANFIKNPYNYTKTLLGGERTGHLHCSKEEVEKYLHETHSDKERETHLGYCSRVEEEKQPTIEFETKEPTWKEVCEVVKKARTGSAPGYSGVPYKVYKKCPKIHRKLWQLFRILWKKGTIPERWQKAEGCFVPKEKDSKDISQFRTISLLSVEGKIYFPVLANRMTKYMVENIYIDTSMQKGGIAGFSGCVEHTSVLSQLIHEAKTGKKNLAVVWLDLANAYGSVPHKLIEMAMDHYHIPEHIKKIVLTYFDGILLRFTVDNKTTAWQKLEKGIVTGCTISPILFIMGMNIIMKAAERETRGPKTDSGIFLPATRGFMDDLTVTTSSHIQARWILTALEEVVTWARMKFKPRKSRSMILKKGKITTKFQLKIQGDEIPTIVGNPIKCLGKWFDDTLKDNTSVKTVQTQVVEWLKKVDKSGLPGKFKAWIYQHGLLPRLTWLLMIYEMTATTVEAIERKINSHLRRWLEVPPSFTAIGLYSRSSQLQLPLTSTLEEYKVSKSRLVMTLRDLKDSKISEAGIQTRTGRKWSARTAVDQAESILHHKDIVGNTCTGRQGLGMTHFQQWSKATLKEKSSMVQSEIRTVEEESSGAKPSRCMYEVELARKKDHMGRVMEDGTIQNLIHAKVSVRYTSFSFKLTPVGTDRRTKLQVMW